MLEDPGESISQTLGSYNMYKPDLLIIIESQILDVIYNEFEREREIQNSKPCIISIY